MDITPEGLAAVRAELAELTGVRRPSIVEKIKVARELELSLCSRFDIGHTTIQVESCHPCAGDLKHGPDEHNHPHLAVG